MKNLIFSTLLFGLSVLQLSCGGTRYVDSPPLSFSEIEYGFPTKMSSTEIPIAYIDEGEGTTTYVLVHGLASNAGFWRYNIEALSKTGRVIAIDLPGYGKSAKGDYAYSMSFYAHVLNEFIQSLDLTKVVLVGHSMGGQVGMTLSILYPNSIDRLVLAAPAGIETFSEGSGTWLRNVFRMDAIIKTPEPAIRENLALNFYRWNKKWEWMVEERTRMAKSPEMKEFAYTVVQCVGAMLDEPTGNQLGKINHPTLIIHGNQDGLIPNRYLNPGFPTDVFEKGVREISNASRIGIPKAGHLVMIEKPQAFNSALLNWLN